MKDTWILFVRHGETDWNREKRMQGQMEIPLNAIGKLQARKIGKQLKDYPIDIMYVSPQIRAHKTALAIHKHHPKIPLLFHEKLKERAFGEIEGKSFDEVCRAYPTMEFELSWDYPDFRPPGGERIRDVYERGVYFLNEILPKHEGKTIAIVSHGVTIRCMVCAVMNFPLSHNAFFELGNTSLTVIKKPNKRDAEIHFLNSTSHLKTKPV